MPQAPVWHLNGDFCFYGTFRSLSFDLSAGNKTVICWNLFRSSRGNLAVLLIPELCCNVLFLNVLIVGFARRVLLRARRHVSVSDTRPPGWHLFFLIDTGIFRSNLEFWYCRWLFIQKQRRLLTVHTQGTYGLDVKSSRTFKDWHAVKWNRMFSFYFVVCSSGSVCRLNYESITLTLVTVGLCTVMSTWTLVNVSYVITWSRLHVSCYYPFLHAVSNTGSSALR